MIGIAVLHLFFASTFPLSKLLLTYASPAFVITSRMFLAAVILLGTYFLRGGSLHLTKRDAWYVAVYAIVAFYISFISEFWALRYMPAAKTCLLYNTAPFVTALFAWLWFGKTLGKKQVLGLFVGFLSFMPMIMATSTGAEQWTSFAWPEFMTIVAVATGAFGWILTQHLVVERGHSSFLINGFGMLGGGLLSAVHVLLTNANPYVTDWLPYLGLLGVVTLVSNIVMFMVQTYLLQFYSATFLSFTRLIAPLYSYLIGFVLLSEAAPPYFFVTFGVLAVGLTLFYLDEVRSCFGS